MSDVEARSENGPVTWGKLHDRGCAFGRTSRERIRDLEQGAAQMKDKIDRMTWALVAAAISLGMSAVLLALNLLVK